MNPGDAFNIGDDWLGADVVNAADLTDFPDDFITASLAAFSGRDEDLDDADLQAFMPDRLSTRSPGLGLRGSFSMNDLTTLQHHVGSPSWNHKLVSVKPKLESVPEGGPSTGGPLNLMPLGGGPSGGGSGRVQGMGGGPALQLPPLSGHHHHGPMQHGQHTINGVTSMPPAGAGDYVDLDSPAPGGMRGSLPSAGTLAAQLQMTHVRSETHLPLPEPPHPAANGFLQGTTAAAVDAFRRSLVSLEGPGGMQGAPGGPNMPPPFQPGQGGGPADHLANGHASRHGHMGPPPMGSTAVQGHQPGAAGPSGAQGAPEMVPTAVARRAPSGLPLRKSQSAVELGSWRGGFGAAEEFWADMGLGPTDAKALAGGSGGAALHERMAKIQRYRDKRLQRNTTQPKAVQGSTPKLQGGTRKATASTSRAPARGARLSRTDEHAVVGSVPGLPALDSGARKGGRGGRDSTTQETTGGASSGGHTTSSGGGAAGGGVYGSLGSDGGMHGPGGQCVSSGHLHAQQQHQENMRQQMRAAMQQQQAAMLASLPPPPPGVHIIGAGPSPPNLMMPPQPNMPMRVLSTSMPPAAQPLPPGIAPASGGIFSGAVHLPPRSASQDMGPLLGSSAGGMGMSGMMDMTQVQQPGAPLQYMGFPPGGQTIFSGSLLAPSTKGSHFPVSGSASAQPSLSPPMLDRATPAGPSNESDCLSVGALSTGRSG